MNPGWYPRAADYWIDPDAAGDYPRRYGDVFATPELPETRTSKDTLWHAVLVLHPSCELGAKATGVSRALVARVYRVADIGAKQHATVRAGFVERDGAIGPAHVNTFWMPPVPAAGDVDLFADFRSLVQVPTAALERRLAAMTHEARLHLIRREMLFKYRWQVPLEVIRNNEIARIEADPHFEGPRPDWAAYRP